MIDARNCDVVYILRNDINMAPEELRYSIRSVMQNFPHRNIWFVGGCPTDISPDYCIRHTQIGNTKWSRVKSSLQMIIKNNQISDNFFLFNDDFFVLQPQEPNFINYSNRTLKDRVQELNRNIGRPSLYTNSLIGLEVLLKTHNFPTKNFALHLPILLNKELVAHTLQVFPKNTMFRSAYGNIHNIETVEHKDVKIYDNFTIPDATWDYVSTTETSFAQGRVGQYIRNSFNKPTVYELFYLKERYTEEGDDLY